MRKKYLIFCFLVFNGFITSKISQAQHLQKPVRILTTKDGIPQSFISGLAQDKDGFVWIGTRNGLVRYDGLHFKPFQHSSKDPGSLASSLIISLALDKNNHLWIEHESSNLDCLDPVTETIDHVTARPLFRLQPTHLVRRGWISDAEDNLWCAKQADGLYKYDWKHNNVIHYSHEKNGLPSDTVRGLLIDKKQRLWIFSQQGISLFDSRTHLFSNASIPFPLDFGTYINSEAEIVALHERNNGEIMMSDRKQLIFFNPQHKSFRVVPLPQYGRLGIRWIQTGPDGYEYLESNGIVYRYDDAQGLAPIGDIGLASFRDAQSFLIDRSGFIWLGTNAAGIHQIDLSAPFFESHPTSFSFHYDLLRQQFGILLDQFSGWPLSDKQFYLSGYFFRSTYDHDHRLWIALRNRVGYYDTLRKNYVLLPPVPNISTPDNFSLGIRGIKFSQDGILWIISNDGYIGYFDSLQHNWITFLPFSAIQHQFTSSITFQDFVIDGNKLWISTGTGDGLLSVDRRTKEISQFNQKTHPDLLPTNLILGLKTDPSRPELLWIGTYEGLVCLDKNTLKSEIFSTDQGLPDNTIYSILSDKAGYLWLGTNKGLCRFHPVTHEVRVFKTADGLPGDEFNRFHQMQLPDGRLAFGGTEGWVLFDPTTIKPDHYQPPVAFTSLRINNILVNNSVNGLLPAPLNGLKELSLPYDENTLTFEFAGLEFNQPAKLLYRYQLKGIDDQWIITNNPVANYTKLRPGHYTLKLNATNTTGQWSPFIRILSVTVNPPFYQTWWAYGIYILLFGGLIMGYIHYRLNKERLQQEVILKEREAEQLKAVDELKSRFFSNITHEFRTPLTMILTPAQRLKETLKLTSQQRWMAAIERNTYQLLRLINQLLDITRLESGTLKVHEAHGNIFEVLERVVQSFSVEADNKEVRLYFKNNILKGGHLFDADKLEQIITNLVANALKFSTNGGEVELALYEEQSTSLLNERPAAESKDSFVTGVVITVSDKGIGIPADQLPYIFNRFYQVENAGTKNMDYSHQQGSGIGLSLVKELVDLQGGTITANSPGENSWHTTFTIWLPYRTTNLTAMPVPEKQVSNFISANNSEGELRDLLPGWFDEDKELPSILLVEDNIELAGFIADSLPAIYNISHTVNGADGLAKAFAIVPDLVISDVLMPVMNGYEFCRKLKEDDRTNHIPVIMLTAKASFEDRIEGLTLGADDYLTKPFHVQELQLRIHNLLERQRLLREKLHRQLSQPGTTDHDTFASKQRGLQEIFIKRLYEIIEDKLDDSAFGVRELATNIGMSRTNLHNKLKAVTGLPAGDIIRNYRLKRAAQFLKDGNNSSETAYKVGFDSPAYFTKCFREFYKITPLEFAQKSQ